MPIGSLPFPEYSSGLDVSNGFAYLAGTYNGLYVIDISDLASPRFIGISDPSVDPNVVVISGGKAFVADFYYGLKIMPTQCGDPSPVELEWPDRRSLILSVYPNPFNLRTKIMLESREPIHAQVAVYSLAGQRIAILFDGWMETGCKEIFWDGRDITGRVIASGKYLTRAKTSAGIDAQKVILMK